MEGYRTKLGGEVTEHVAPEHEYRHPDDYREPVIDFALKAAEEAVGAVRRRLPGGRIPAGALGRRHRHLQRGPAGGRASGTGGRLNGEEPDAQLLLLVDAAGARGGARGRVRHPRARCCR